jgi:hypothetical protein
MKVLEKRLEECMNIRFQLKNVGIETQYALELQPLFDIMNSFIREGTSSSGSLSIDSDYFTKIDYMFTCNDAHNSYCNIVR